MPIVINCAACNTRLTLGDDRAGDRFECPQCDAMIKVPGPSQPPPRAPAQTAPPPKETERVPQPNRRSRAAEPEFEDEPQGPDKRVVAGVVAGVAALLIVAVAGVALAVRKPAETAQKEEPPTPTVSRPASAPATVLDFTSPPPPSAPTTAEPGPSAPSVTPSAPAVPQFEAQFFGSQGKGRRFCIIADNSNSMRGAKLANLKTELLKTITELNQDAEYYVIAFNARPESMPHPTWLRAGAAETDKVKEWVKGLGTQLGTFPVPAFETAFRLNPPPDVIFFMTDGQFAATVPGQVVALNGTPSKSVVNTILFAAPAKGTAAAKATAAEGQLKHIADQNRGTFTRYAPP